MSFDQILQAFSATLHNQILSGGLLLMSVGSVLALCRRVPWQMLMWCGRRVIVTVDISNDDPLFSWISLWLSEQPYTKRARILTATSEKDGYGRTLDTPAAGQKESALPSILLTPAPGNHLLVYQHHLLWLTRERKEASASRGKDDWLSLWKREVFTVRTVARNQKLVRAFLEDARSAAMSRRHRKTELFIGNYDFWQSIGERDPRPLSTVFLPLGITTEITQDLTAFLASKEWYAARGIPYRRGYLLHGLPGTGKTSLICALAGHFKMNLYILNLASAALSDDRLANLLSQVPARSMVLLEDVDAAFSQRKKSRDAPNKVTFSGVLNALDGAGSKDGTLLFMTTNRVAELDAALIRPGRADYHLEFGHATPEQAAAMFQGFFPEQSDAAHFGELATVTPTTMATVQHVLIAHKDSPTNALDAFSRKAIHAVA